MVLEGIDLVAGQQEGIRRGGGGPKIERLEIVVEFKESNNIGPCRMPKLSERRRRDRLRAGGEKV